ncbi:hypothetical protein Ccrd_011050 [Cynara cardunculus var. scolymus]|uniref:PHD-type domain-containing protein n=1 Tax=Cynara cardunculus var. scolymus TaxID=59895 RepID=A0A103YK39_CYNCS|nr:hypothetical protein Ccrd_011050 [Cynara cardunculus var. scolymus]
MENNFHGLPPHKRFRLMHQEKPAIDNLDFNFPFPSCLPAKKRKESRYSPPFPTNLDAVAAGATYCLPAKKRITALHPNFLSEKPLSSFDLNLEYDPKSDEDNTSNPESVSKKGDEIDEIKEEEEEEEDGIIDPEGREGIDCSMVPSRRWGKRCYVCKKSNGCAIDCSEEKCCLSFHVTCGLKEDLCIEYKEGRNKGTIVAGFCKSHSDLWMKQQATGKYKIVARNEDK